MKKKILLLAFSAWLMGIVPLMAQWNLGGNVLPAGGSTIGSDNAEPIIFETNAFDRGRITNAGLWGINTGAVVPGARFHINSSLNQNALRVDVNNIAKLLLHSGGGLSVGSGSTPPANGLYVSGNTGFGITVPTAKVHISHNSSSTSPQLLLYESANDFARLQFKNTNTANHFAIAGSPAAANASAKLNFYYSPTGNAMTVQGDGNVGIGNDAPTQKLQVAGNIDFDGDGTELRFHDLQFFRDAPGNANLEIQTHADLAPDNPCVHDLGTPDLTWRNLYLCGNVVNTSDGRLKENVQNLGYGLAEILKLRPVTYNWLKNPDGKKNIGLIAQEVQKVLPEMVSDSRMVIDEKTGKTNKVANSKLGIEYNALIPVLIKALQEQQAAIESKDKQLNDLQSKFDALQSELVKKGVLSGNGTSSSSAKSEVIHESAANVQLYQNAPNPFDRATTIRYMIPAGARAQILISDLSGKMVKTLPASKGGQVQVNAFDLPAGTYIYSLVVNGQTADSKKMVLLK